MNNFQYRQGDVYLFQVDKLPEGMESVKPIGKNQALAFGEATGHAHCIAKDDCELYTANDNLRALAKKHGVTDGRAVTHGLRIVVDNAKLLHGTPARGFIDLDHTPIDIPCGDYIVLRPREYDDSEEFRAIAD